MVNWRYMLVLAVSATYMTACAQDVGDIDRTKPNKVEKSLFQNDDEWYYQQTVVQTDFASGAGWDGFVFPALEGGLFRIRWTITEDTLYAYSSLEPVDGAHEGLDAEGDRRVGLIAAFPIISHFDVQRGYSSATGEQSNTISENGSDRNWYERKYMRVNWSRNLVSNGFHSIEGIFGTFSVSTRDVPQEDGIVDPDRTRISDSYIDTVTEYNFEPSPIQCWQVFGFDAAYTCQGGPVRMRHSFLKVPEEVSYEPMEYLDQKPITDSDGDRILTKQVSYYDFLDPNTPAEVQGLTMEVECTPSVRQFDKTIFGSGEIDDCSYATVDYYNKFGAFRTERLSYEPNYGSNNEASRRYYANRWNIWNTAYNEDGELLDMSERTPKPIVYYTNVAYPNYMWDDSQEVARQWDEVFTNAVAQAQGVSTDDVTSAVDTAHANGGAMFEIRRNSCSPEGITAYYDAHGGASGTKLDLGEIRGEFEAQYGTLDPGTHANWDSAPTNKQLVFCAELEYATEDLEADKQFVFQRPGDLRYSLFNWHETANTFWSGYGPSAADPKTGEIIAGDANYAGQRHEYVTTVVTDYIRYMNGDLPENDLIGGEQIWEHIQDQRANHRSQKQELRPEGRQELDRRFGKTPETYGSDMDGPRDIPLEIRKHGLDRIKQDAFLMSRANHLAKASDTRAAEFFDLPEVKQAVLSDPNFRVMVEARAAGMFGPNFNDDEFHQAYLSAKAPNLQYDRYEQLNNAMSERNIMMNNVMEDQMMSLVTYSGIADHFKGASTEDIRDYVRSKFFISVQLHEVGHTLGMAHNFAGTYDAMNYQDEFWQIQQAVANGDLTMDERHSLSKERAEQILGKELRGNTAYFNQAEYRNASIMDYGGDITSDFDGLGKYDNAYIHFIYANQVEQFDESVNLRDDWDFDLFVSDYTEIPRIIEGVNTISDKTEEEIRQLQISGIQKLLSSRKWVSLKDMEEQRYNGIKANTTNLEQQIDDDLGGNTQQIVTADSIWIDQTVPYRYCTNGREWVELGCATGDWGANQREVVNHKFDKYRIFQPIQRYNRGRLNKAWDNVNNYYNFVYGTLRSVEVPFRLYSYYQWFSFLEDLRDDLQEASIDSINFYAEIAGKPEAGRFCRFDETNSRVDSYWWYDDALRNAYVPSSYHSDVGGCPGFIDIPRGVGEFYNFDINNEYDYRVNRVGTYVDKELATSVLFQIAGNFVGSSFITDFRATNISYWTLFQDELYEFLRGIILGDYSGFAGVYDPTTASYEPAMLVDRKTFGLPNNNPQRNMARIFTPMSFNHEFNSLAYSMIFNSGWQDREVDFSQYVKVSVTNGESQEFPVGAVLHTFEHPTTNQIYTAPEGPGGRSIAVDLITYANNQKLRMEEADTALVTAEAALNACSANCAGLEEDYRDADNLARVRSEQMEEVVGKLDTIRYVFEAIGQDSLR